MRLYVTLAHAGQVKSDWNSSLLLMGMQNDTLENSLAVFNKIQHAPPLWSAAPVPDPYPDEMSIYVPGKTCA